MPHHRKGPPRSKTPHRRPRIPPSARTVALVAELRAQRLAREWSQTEVCERAGVDLTGFSRVELGHTAPGLDYFVRVAEALGLELTLRRRRA